MYVHKYVCMIFSVIYVVQKEGDCGLNCDLFGLSCGLSHGLNLEVAPYSNVNTMKRQREQQELCPASRDIILVVTAAYS